MTTASARALLTGLVDYAGLFPPAALSMDAAVAEYARWRRSPEAFMLGRFVVPAARLVELARAADAHFPEPDGGELAPGEPESAHPRRLAPGRPEPAGPRGPWRVSALVGGDAHGDAARIASFNDAHAGRAVVDAVELKAASAAQATAALEAFPTGLTAFVEVPLDENLDGLLAALKRRGARAKIRTGGVVPEAIPDPAGVARFISACASAGVPWKATAGLHHPLRSEQALTYEPASQRAVMHGFLNVFAAAAFARAGAGLADIEAVLQEQDTSAFRFDDERLAWRQLRVTTAELAATRREFAGSFGSCSFAEPVADLERSGVLPAAGLPSSRPATSPERLPAPAETTPSRRTH